jgi:hypothetical protein
MFGSFLFVGCIFVTVYKCCRNICYREQYNLPDAERANKKRYDEESGDRYEMQPLTSSLPTSPASKPRRGTKVMVLNEAGHIPPHTLRSRGSDGSVRYKTRYNPEIGSMETEL